MTGTRSRPLRRQVDEKPRVGGADTAARRDQTRPRQRGRRARRTSSRAARGSAAPRPARASGAPRTRAEVEARAGGARARLWHRRLPARPGGRPRSASAPGSGAPRGVGEAHPARHRARRAAAPGRGRHEPRAPQRAHAGVEARVGAARADCGAAGRQCVRAGAAPDVGNAHPERPRVQRAAAPCGGRRELGRLTNARRGAKHEPGGMRCHEISARWPPSGGRTRQPAYPGTTGVPGFLKEPPNGHVGDADLGSDLS